MRSGQVIKLIRMIDGISQRVLAKRLDVTPSYLCQIENGRKRPSMNLLRAFSRKFRVPLPLLVLDEEGTGGNDKVFEEIKRLLSDLVAARTAQAKEEGLFRSQE